MRLITFSGLLALALCLWLVTLSRPRDAAADEPTVQIIANLPSGQPVGTIITWTASTTISESVEYRLALGLMGEPLRVIYDFGARHTFQGAPLAGRKAATSVIWHTFRRA